LSSIAFDRADFCSATTGYGPAEVVVVGELVAGRYFYGTDTIKIVSNHLMLLADLASHWSETGCDESDWCEGADLNQDSTVNFFDFALLEYGCCIEVIEQ